MTHKRGPGPGSIATVRSLLAGLIFVGAVGQPAVAVAQKRVVLQGAPISSTKDPNSEVRVSAPNAVSYKYSLNGAPYSDEIPIQTPINSDATVVIGDRTFKAGSSELYQFINQRTGASYNGPDIERVSLGSVTSQQQITYLLNKIRSAVRTENVLNLSGPGVGSLDVRLAEKSPAGDRYELNSLGVTGGKLLAATSSDSTRRFVLTLPPDALSVALTPATNNVSTTIAVNGQQAASGSSVMLSPGNGSSILLQTTGPDGSHATYQIDVRYDDSLARTDYRSYYLRAFTPSSAYVSMRNSGADTVRYEMTFNNTLGLTKRGIVDEIVAMPPEFPDEPIQRKAWRFIRDNRYHFIPLSGTTWFSSVALFFNSAGFGFCDDSAALFSQLMTELGYPTRVWGLNGHVVAEVLVNGRWEMWDPDLEVYYYTEQGLVAGVEDLANNPALITSPSQPIFGPSAFPYQQYVADLYSSRDDNSLVPDDPMADSSVLMEIPPRSVFEFPDLYETPLDVMQLEKAPSYTNARLVVPAGFSGSVNMPLIIHSIGWSNHPTLSVLTKDGAGQWDATPTTVSWAVDFVPPGTTASQPSGVYSREELVTLTANEPATLYYSTYAGTPTEGFLEYTAPIGMPNGFVQFFGVDGTGNREQVRAYGPSIEEVSLQMSSAVAATVTFSATASGGVGIYEFSFRLYVPGQGWSEVQAYGNSNDWVWNSTGATPGRYTVEVLARNRGTTEQVVKAVDLAFDVSQTEAPTIPTPILPVPGNPPGSTPPGYSQAVLTDAPAGYWRLDETTGTIAANSAGSASGTLVGGVTPGQPGALVDGTTAMLFDGSTGYVQVASTPALQLAGDLTIEMWVNVSLAKRQTLISKDYLHEFELTLEIDGRLNLYQGNGSNYDGVLSTLGAVTANTWQHVVVTRTAATKTVRFYVNGIAAGSRTYVTSPTTSAVAVFIGRTAGGIQPVNGRLDEVALYSAALSPAQVSAHWAKRGPAADVANYLQAVLADMPAAYWRLDETAGTIAGSSTGTGSGSLVGGVTLGQPGALADGSTAMRFDGSTGYMQVASSPELQLAGDLTIELWVNVSLATRQTLISKGYLHEFELTLETDGALNLYQGNGSTYQGMLSAAGAVSANAWQHIVVTRSAATKTVWFYVNGVASSSRSYVTIPTPGLAAVFIGRAADGGQTVNGRIDEVALYPVALSPSQIAAHWAKRLSAGVPSIYQQAVVASGPIAYWPFDETTGTIAASSAGTASGTLAGGVTLGQPGALPDTSTAIRFDGSTGFVQVASTPGLQLAGDLTIELWVNVSLARRQTLVSKDYLHEFELTLETNGRLNLYQGDGSAYAGVLSAFGAVTPNTWQHVVVTRTAATRTVRFYIDGVAAGSGTYTTAPAAGTAALSIGRSADGAQYVNGLLDEVALYSVALNPAQISAHWAKRTPTSTP